MLRLIYVSFLLVAIVVAGCGGGGDGKSSSPIVTLRSDSGEKTVLLADSATDFSLSCEVDVKRREGSVYFRLSPDGLNGYGMVFCPFASQGAIPGFFLVKRISGVEKGLAVSKSGFPRTNGMARLEITVKGNAFTVYEGGKIILQVQDSEFKAGRLVWRVYGSQTNPAEANFKLLRFEPTSLF